MKKIDQQHQLRLDAVREKQRQNAYCLGVLLIEHEQALARLAQPIDAPQPHERYGALVWEFEHRKRFFIETVRRTEEEQLAAGEDALRAVGVDPESGEFTISSEGIVLQLIEGAWRGVD